MLDPLIRFRIDFGKHAHVGPGKIDLLETIARTGSLSQAARDLGMSYRRAWLLVHSLNTGFSKPVTRASTGGRGGGGVTLTPFGAELIAKYRDLEREFAGLAAHQLRRIRAAVASRPAAAGRDKIARRPLARRETAH